jgi:hypothetical protein
MRRALLISSVFLAVPAAANNGYYFNGSRFLAEARSVRIAYVTGALDSMFASSRGDDSAFFRACFQDGKWVPSQINTLVENMISQNASYAQQSPALALYKVAVEICGLPPSFENPTRPPERK